MIPQSCNSAFYALWIRPWDTVLCSACTRGFRFCFSALQMFYNYCDRLYRILRVLCVLYKERDDFYVVWSFFSNLQCQQISAIIHDLHFCFTTKNITRIPDMFSRFKLVSTGFFLLLSNEFLFPWAGVVLALLLFLFIFRFEILVFV